MLNSEIAALATELGHAHVQIREDPRGWPWIVECSCGFGAGLDRNGHPPVRAATFDEAVKVGKHHLRKAVETYLGDLRRNGASARRVSLIHR